MKLIHRRFQRTALFVGGEKHGKTTTTNDNAAKERQIKVNSKQEKKEEIWLSPVINTPTPTEKKQMWQHKNATKSVDYTTIADRLRTVSWSNSSHPTGVVKPVYERSTFPLTETAV